MRNFSFFRKRHLHFFFMILFGLMCINGNSQTIDPHFFGINAWMPDTVGSEVKNGKLHSKWAEVKSSGVKLIRIGGIAFDREFDEVINKNQFVKLIDSIRANGMEPLVQVGYDGNNHSASMSADLVDDLNNTLNKNIKYWSISNEPIKQFFSSNENRVDSVAAYVKRFSSAMKEKDSTIKIIAPEFTHFRHNPLQSLLNSGANDITGKISGHTYYYVDIISYHYYPYAGGAQTRQGVIDKLRGSFDDNLDLLNSWMSDANTSHNRSGDNELRCALTEINVTWDGTSGDSPSGTGASSFLGGQFWAEAIEVALEKNVKFINFWSVAEGEELGYINHDFEYQKPSYYHFKLLADNFKGTFCKGSDNENQIKAFGSKNEEHVCVMVMNQHQSGSYPFALKLDNQTASGSEVLKIKIDAGVNATYRDTIADETTFLLIFDLNGNLLKKIKYSRSDAELGLPPSSQTSSQTTVLIDKGATWKYNDSGSNLGTSWKGTSYDDSGWSSGAAELGYGDSDEATTVSYGGNPNNKYITTYFRKSFSVSNKSEFQDNLDLSVLRDDGAVVYLNGTEIYRNNLPSGTISYSTTATTSISGSAEDYFVYYGIPSSLLVNGTNHLAVEIHQSDATSSDISFDLKLVAEKKIMEPCDFTALLFPSDTAGICQGDSLKIYLSYGDDYTYQWMKDGSNISGATSYFYTATQTGSYKVIITDNATSCVDTSDATVIVTDATACGSCTIDSTLTWEYWGNETGENPAFFDFNTDPDSTSYINTFEADSNFANNYASRIRGYICAPQTGYYRFWIAGDNKCELYLSPDASPGSKTKIAYVNDWTYSRQWEKESNQKSLLKWLEAGNKYYIEVVHKEGTGGDNVAVGWELPGGALERPIPAKRISSYVLPQCTAEGVILREYWLDMSSASLSSIPFNEFPDGTSFPSSFDAPQNFDDNYGSRIRGYVCAPVSGNYHFWIASDDDSELWFSSDENPANKTRIAYVDGYTNHNEWTKDTSTQKSAAIFLEKNRKYYIEAIHVDGTQGDHISVGWTLPSGTHERPIGSNRLSPFEASYNELISKGAEWKYLDNGSDQGTSWRTTSFNDNSWSRGMAELGYGDSTEVTVVSYGGTPSNKYITTYFRKKFSVSDPSSYDSLEISLLADDGAVIYLNNTEVVRSNMPTGTITYTTLASTFIDGANETKFNKHKIGASALQQGDNVLAVEIHQNSATSSDISFDLSLRGITGAQCPSPTDIWASSTTSSSTWIGWNEVSNSASYFIQYRDSGNTVWTNISSNTNFKFIDGLDPSTKYEFRVKTVCTNNTSDYTSISYFTTGSCTNDGKILREVWNNVTGDSIAGIPFNSIPSDTSYLTSFEGPSNYGDNYGSRISGYICPPQTGKYIFWIKSDDKSELWISDNDNPANKRKIAYVDSYTSPTNWEEYSSQKSDSISLVSGKKYYIEAVHKEGTQSDHLAVGWKLPDATLERPIPGNRLSLYNASYDTLLVAFDRWKYLDNGTNQNTEWRNSDFNDLSWKSNWAELGYGDGDEYTIISYGSDANNKYITTYFRKTFNLDDPNYYSAYELQLLRDDGAVVYLNENEVMRSNMPSGTITYTTTASTALSGSDETTFVKGYIDRSNIVQGKNVVAVEIHQNSGTSSDLSFNLRLIGLKQPNSCAAKITPSTQQTICTGDSVALVANTGYGITYRWFKDGNIISGATSSTYYAKDWASYQVETTKGSCISLSSPVNVITQVCGGGMIQNPNGVEKPEDKKPFSLNIYPNPSKGNIIVELSSPEKLEEALIEVQNTLGQTIYRKRYGVESNSIKESFDLRTGYSDGIYFVKVSFNNENHVKKIIVLK